MAAHVAARATRSSFALSRRIGAVGGLLAASRSLGEPIVPVVAGECRWRACSAARARASCSRRSSGRCVCGRIAARTFCRRCGSRSRPSRCCSSRSGARSGDSVSRWASRWRLRAAARRSRVRRAVASRDEGACRRARARHGAWRRDAPSHANVRAARAYGLRRLSGRRSRAHAAARDVGARDAGDGDGNARAEAAGGVGAGARRDVRQRRRLAARVAGGAGDASNDARDAAGSIRRGPVSARARAPAARGAQRRRARDRQHAPAGLGHARVRRVRRHVGQWALRHAVHPPRDLRGRRTHRQRVRGVRAERAWVRGRRGAALRRISRSRCCCSPARRSPDAR